MCLYFTGFIILIAAIFGLGTMCVQKKGMLSLGQENQTMIVNEMKGEKDTLMKESVLNWYMGLKTITLALAFSQEYK